MESSPERAEIVRTVVTLAGHLKLDVVAEGVENSSELSRLREYGCDLAQGFFFSRPVDRETAEALVAREVEVLDATRRSDRPQATGKTAPAKPGGLKHEEPYPTESLRRCRRRRCP